MLENEEKGVVISTEQSLWMRWRWGPEGGCGGGDPNSSPRREGSPVFPALPPVGPCCEIGSDDGVERLGREPAAP